MALSNNNYASNTDFLHPDKKTYTSRKTNNIGLRWTNQKAILLCWQNSSANSTTTVLKSYLKDTTDFINFIEKTKLPKGIILVSMDVTSLYTNIPQDEGINIVCTAYETSYNETPPTPKPLPSTLTLRWSLKKDEHRQRCLQKLLFYSIFGVAFMCIISKIKRPFRGDRINAKGIVTNLFKSFLAGVWLNRLVSFSDYTLRYCIRFIWLVRLTFYDTSMET